MHALLKFETAMSVRRNGVLVIYTASPRAAISFSKGRVSIKPFFMAKIDFHQVLSVISTMHWLLYDEILDYQVMRFRQYT